MKKQLKKLGLFILYCILFDIASIVAAYCYGFSWDTAQISLLVVLVIGFMMEQKEKWDSLREGRNK